VTEQRNGPQRFPEITADLADAARAYCEMGFAIFPVAPKRKAPPQITRWQIEASTDWGKWSWRWAGKPHPNIGIHLGKSQLVLGDADGPVAREIWREMFPDLPPTPSIRTRRGWHWYFRAPECIEFRSQILHRNEDGNADLELRTGDHYVIAPASVVEGFFYEPSTLEVDFSEWPEQYSRDERKRAGRVRKASTTAQKTSTESASESAEIRKLIADVVQVERGPRRHALALSVGFRLARAGFPQEEAEAEAEYIAEQIERHHGEVERRSEPFERETKRCIGDAYERVERARSALSATFFKALLDETGRYGQGQAGDQTLSTFLVLIGLAIKAGNVEVAASYRDLCMGTARSSRDSIVTGLWRLQARDLIKRTAPRDKQGERIQGLSNRYLLTTTTRTTTTTYGPVEKDIADIGKERSTGPYAVIKAILSQLAGDAAFSKRPLVLLWATIFTPNTPLDVEQITRIRGRSLLTTRRQLHTLSRYGLAAEDEQGRWSCPLAPDDIGSAAASPFRNRHLSAAASPFLRLAADHGSLGRAARLRLRIEEERAAFHHHGVDARATNRAEVARIQATQAARRAGDEAG
jgi:hypothetical protein